MDRRKRIKWIAVFMCVVLLAGVVVNQTGLLKETTADVAWSGYFPGSAEKNYSYGGGKGVSTNPYIINSADQLAQLKVNVENGFHTKSYFELTVNLDISAGYWQGIGTEDYPFEGSFNGCGYQIAGLNIDTESGTGYGLFGYTNGATIKNLNVSGTVDAGSAKSVGAIVGRASATKISDCTFSGSVIGGDFVGGIVGTMTAEGCRINGCKVTSGSEITSGKSAVGGIVGYMTANTQMFNCANYGTVRLAAETVEDALASAAGGLAGYARGAAVINSYNSGTIQSVAYASGLTVGEGVVISNCYNIGQVSSSTVGKAGAISGYLDSFSSLSGVYFKESSTVDGYPGTLGGTVLKNVGVIAAVNSNLTKYTNGAIQWTMDNRNLKQALASGVSTLLDAETGYPGLVCEWDSDGSNLGYPVLTKTIGHACDFSVKGEGGIGATCTESGTQRWFCSICGEFEDRVTEALGHTYDHSVVEPATCTLSGVEADVCIRCDITQNEIVIPAYDHQKLPKHVDPTCTTDGYDVTICAACPETWGYTVIPSPGHQMDEEGFEIRNANCSSPELHYVHCTVCDYVRTDEVGVKREHDWDAVSGIAVESTCAFQGGIVRTCKYSDCNEQQWLSDREPLTAHVYEFKTKVDPTCEVAGYTLEECSVCHKAQREVNLVAALSHNYKVEKVVDPTCKERGYTQHKCENCGETYEDTYVEVLQHVYILSGDTKPTCNISGKMEYTCDLCGNKKNTDVAALGHSFLVSDELSKEATCTEDGMIVEVCQHDETHLKKTKGADKLGHEYTESVVAPTCLLNGYTLHTCVRGDDEYSTDPVKALGHAYSTSVVAPTISSMGYTVTACTRCDDSSTSDYVAATPNGYFDYKTLSLVLSDIEEPMKYSLDGGESWITTEAVSVSFTEEEIEELIYSAPANEELPMKVAEVDLSGSAVDVKAGAVIQVVRLGNTASEDRPIADSDIQNIEIMMAKEPAGMITTIKPEVKNGKGSVTGVDETMEYRNKNDKTWTPVVGNTIENLEPGVYYIRVQATEQSLASDVIEFTIEEYAPSETNPSDAPIGSAAPGNSEEPGASKEPENSGAPKGSSEPGSSDAPKESSEPGASAKPGETTKPGESAKPVASTKPTNGNSNTNNNGNNTNTGNNNNADSGNNNNSSNGSNNTTNNGSGNQNSGNANNSINNSSNTGTSGTNDGGVIKNDVYYSSNGGSSTSGSNKLKSAKTGDGMNVEGWIVVAGCAVTALAALAVRKRRDVEE